MCIMEHLPMSIFDVWNQHTLISELYFHELFEHTLIRKLIFEFSIQGEQC